MTSQTECPICHQIVFNKLSDHINIYHKDLARRIQPVTVVHEETEINVAGDYIEGGKVVIIDSVVNKSIISAETIRNHESNTTNKEVIIKHTSTSHNNTSLTQFPELWGYPVSKNDQFSYLLKFYFDNYTICKPTFPSQLLNNIQRHVTLIPCYFIHYNIDASFRTSVGEIHHEFLENGAICLPAASAINREENKILDMTIFSSTPLIPNFCNYLISQGAMGNPLDEINKMPAQIFDKEKIYKIAIRKIIEQHTRQVGYTGANNVYYSKVCTPKHEDITISNINQILLPLNEVSLLIQNRNVSIIMVETQSGVFPSPACNFFETCTLCNSKISNKPTICNDCGNITHMDKIINPCGYVCFECGKTLCKNCVYKISDMLIFSKKICYGCAQKYGMKAKRLIG